MKRIELFKKYEEVMEKELGDKNWLKFRSGWESLTDSSNEEEKALVYKSLVEEVLYFSNEKELNEVIHTTTKRWTDNNINLQDFLLSLTKNIITYTRTILQLPSNYIDIDLLQPYIADIDNVYLMDIFEISIKYYLREICKTIQKITNDYEPVSVGYILSGDKTESNSNTLKNFLLKTGHNITHVVFRDDNEEYDFRIYKDAIPTMSKSMYDEFFIDLKKDFITYFKNILEIFEECSDDPKLMGTCYGDNESIAGYMKYVTQLLMDDVAAILVEGFIYALEEKTLLKGKVS